MQNENARYDLPMSIIIPVYNKETELVPCIESLLLQTASSNSFEVVLVDDGSTDNSLAVCHQLEQDYSFVHVISQDNQGVSIARNTGMKAATGNFLLFLDAGDSISERTVELLIDSFHKFGDDVDVVAYRIEYFYPSTNKIKHHKREKWLEDSGVYPLDKYPYIAQSTMNVCIRNRFEDNIQFVPNMKMGEDQLFVTRNLERTGNLGYCSEAIYRYIRDGFNSSTRGNNPLFAFEDMAHLFESLIHISHSNKAIASYAYQLILYNFAWRIESTMLFPTNPDKAVSKAQSRRFETIAKAIPPAEYIDSPYLSEYHKAFLFKYFGLASSPIQTSYTCESASLTLNDGTQWHTVVPCLALERCRCENDILSLSGRIVCPLFIFEGKPTLTFALKNESHDVPLGASSFDCVQSHYATAKSWSFRYELPLDKLESQKRIVSIKVNIDNTSVPYTSIELKPSLHNGFVVQEGIVFNNWSIYAIDNGFVVSKSAFNPVIKKKYKHLCSHSKDLERRIGFRFLSLRLPRGRIWLYADLPTVPTEGNALAQLLYDVKQNDGIARYYVSNFATEIETKHPELKGRVVKAQSKQHQVLSLRSEMVLSSYLEKFTYLPFKQSTFNHLADLAVNQRRIYLQHGILHAHIPWYFSYDRILFDYEVVSTSFEQKNLQTNYFFPAQALIDSGAPRLDAVDTDNRKHGKRIIYIPSWRNYLIGGTSQQRTGNDDTFEHSCLYQGMKSFFAKIAESNILEDNGWTLDIKLHPNFTCYRHLFHFSCDRIHLIDEIEHEGDYALAITDYSSYIYDFVYAGTRVLYYLPDHIEFKAGLNHYSQLDLPYEKGFGPYCETPEEAFNAIRCFIYNPHDDFETTYNERREKFFLHRDGKNRIRLYKKLKQIADDLGN